MKATRRYFNLLSLVIILTLTMSVSAQPVPTTSPQAGQGTGIDVVPPPPPFTIEDVVAQDVENAAPARRIQANNARNAEAWTYIVLLTDPPLANYQGGIAGLAPTNPTVRGERKLDAQSSDSVAYANYLAQERNRAIGNVEKALDRALDVEYEYFAASNGFAAKMTPDEAAKVAQLSGVFLVEREQIRYPQTDAGPWWIGADGIWDGTDTWASGAITQTGGEGIIVGVIDTGVDPWNPSFADVGDDGYDHTNPFGTGTYVGVCDPANTNPPAGGVAYDPTFPCNDKLIGAWGYTASDPNPRDGDGHGSHTGSTAAGNVSNGTVITTPTGVYTANISGVAPHANVIMYDGCADDGGCPGSALQAARDQLLLDGVDVVNYSIGGGISIDPWSTTEELSWLAIRNAGIFVATSAGNDGPDPGTLGSPGDVPWVTTVGSASHNRTFLTSITLDNGTDPPLTLEGVAMSGGYGPAFVVYAADYAGGGISEEDARLCADGVFPPGTFNGEIVVCERGQYGRVAKGQTVFDGGAGGYVLAQPDEYAGGPGALVADPHVLPAIHIDYQTYQTMRAYIANISGSLQYVSGTIADATLDVDDANGDVMAASSSRGPNSAPLLPDQLVPKVTAPGRSIWAAYHQGDGGDGEYTYNVIGGTSMASPHVAGAGALLMALHPEWSPAEIESALMLTARDTVLNDDGVNTATPFAQGSGYVDLSQAGRAGFVLDVAPGAFEAANPDLGGDPKTLNIASMGNADCGVTCTWTRTLTSTLSYPVSWDTDGVGLDGLSLLVSPTTFVLPAYGTQVVTVTANTDMALKDQWVFGTALFTPTTMMTIPTAHMPVGTFSIGTPAIDIEPDVLTSSQVSNISSTQILQIHNVGDGALVWESNDTGASSPDIVQDGSFEAGSPNPYWTEAGSEASPLCTDACGGGAGHTGDWFAWFGGWQTTNTASVDQDVTIPAGSATLKFWLSIEADATDDGTLEFRMDGTPVATFTQDDAASYPDYTEVSVDVSAYADGGTHNLDIFGEEVGTTLINFFVDDVSIEASGGTATFDCTNVDDVPWFSLNPDMDTTAPLSTTLVEATFASHGYALGTYTDTVCIYSNDAASPTVEIPITMTVTSAPGSFGFLEGTVTSQGYCDTNPAPLSGATVTAQGAGDGFAATTNGSGYYYIPLESSDSPYAVTVEHPTHVTSQTTGIDVTAAATTTFDFVVRMDAPCIDVNPLALDVTQAAFSVTVQTLTLDNNGTGDLDWEIFENASALGDVSASNGGVIWEQPASGGSGVLSDYSTTQAGGAYSANDFVLAEDTFIDLIFVAGFDNSDTLANAPAIDWVIYPDTGGVPAGHPEDSGGTEVWSYTSAPGNPGVDLTDNNITLNLIAAGQSLSLSAGTYWLSVYPTYENNVSGQGDPRWNWYQATQVGALAQLVSPVLYSLPAWTSCSSLTQGSIIDLAFRLEGFATGGCESSDIPWITNVAPRSGSLSKGAQQMVDVTFDSTDMPVGVYTGELCVSSNDPIYGAVPVPVTLTVASLPNTPSIILTKTVGTEANVCADSASISVLQGEDVYYCYTVENTGDITLTAHTLWDDQLGTIDSFSADLAPGATMQLTATAAIVTDTMNTAVWTATHGIPYTARATDTAQVNIAVLPIAAFVPTSSTISVGDTVTFSNQSTGSEPLSYAWDFGDGSPESNDVNPSHTYTQTGTFTVTLDASNPYGTDDADATVVVTGDTVYYVYLPVTLK